MNQKSHLLQIFFFAIKNEFLLFKVNKQGKTNRLNDGRFPLILLLFQRAADIPPSFSALNILVSLIYTILYPINYNRIKKLEYSLSE